MLTRSCSALAAFVLAIALMTPPAATAETSNLFLPNRITVDPGRVSLYADYEAVSTDGSIPVYLVNDSGRELVLDTQDGNPYLKLEYRDAAGNWVRAQPHGYSWCGNSYVSQTLRPGHHLVLAGYQRVNGERQTVRYRLYEQAIDITSNAGEGTVSMRDVELASQDALSVKFRSFDELAALALNDAPVENRMDHIRDLRDMALERIALEDFEPAQSREVLRQVAERRPDTAERIEQLMRYVDERDSPTAP